MIVGVGGQGTLLASKILGNVLMTKGYDVKMSEVHGMAQRGGSVVTYVKYADEPIASPVIEKGEADLIIAFEQLEAARWISYLKKGGTLITNTTQILPMPVITGAKQYPEELLEKMTALDCKVIALDVLSKAKEAGNAKAVNVVLLGVLAKNLPIDKQVWLDCIRDSVAPKFLEVNEKAFELGYTN